MGLGAPGTPGAYRDRYLNRVTINTNSWKVALGIILGPCGKVTYTYLYSPLSAPFRSCPPSSSSSPFILLRLLCSSSCLDRTRIIISDRSMIVRASLLLMLYVSTPTHSFLLLSQQRERERRKRDGARDLLLSSPLLSFPSLFSHLTLHFSSPFSFFRSAVSLSRFRRASLLFLFRHEEEAFSSPRGDAPFVIRGSLIEAHPSV